MTHIAIVLLVALVLLCGVSIGVVIGLALAGNAAKRVEEDLEWFRDWGL